MRKKNHWLGVIFLRTTLMTIDGVSRDYLSTYTTGIRAVKYDKKLQFFSERRDMVIDALEKFQSSCPKLRKYVIDSMVRFTEKYVIWNEKEQYDLLSKLNTNYSGAAYMLTVGLPEKYKNSVSYENALKYFFDEKNKDGVTPFESFMGELETKNKLVPVLLKENEVPPGCTDAVMEPDAI